METTIRSMDKALDLLEQLKRRGVIFGAKVTKRSDGTERVFNAKPIEDSLNDYDLDRNLMTVLDNKRGHPRSINLPGLQEVRVDGKIYKFDLS